MEYSVNLISAGYLLAYFCLLLLIRRQIKSSMNRDIHKNYSNVVKNPTQIKLIKFYLRGSFFIDSVHIQGL